MAIAARQVLEAPHKIETATFEFAVTDPASPLYDAEALTAAIRRELAPAIEAILDEATEAVDHTVLINDLEIDLGQFPADPDWNDVRTVFTEALRTRLAEHFERLAFEDRPALSPDRLQLLAESDDEAPVRQPQYEGDNDASQAGLTGSLNAQLAALAAALAHRAPAPRQTLLARAVLEASRGIETGSTNAQTQAPVSDTGGNQRTIPMSDITANNAGVLTDAAGRATQNPATSGASDSLGAKSTRNYTAGRTGETADGDALASQTSAGPGTSVAQPEVSRSDDDGAPEAHTQASTTQTGRQAPPTPEGTQTDQVDPTSPAGAAMASERSEPSTRPAGSAGQNFDTASQDQIAPSFVEGLSKPAAIPPGSTHATPVEDAEELDVPSTPTIGSPANRHQEPAAPPTRTTASHLEADGDASGGPRMLVRPDATSSVGQSENAIGAKTSAQSQQSEGLAAPENVSGPAAQGADQTSGPVDPKESIEPYPEIAPAQDKDESSDDQDDVANKHVRSAPTVRTTGSSVSSPSHDDDQHLDAETTAPPHTDRLDDAASSKLARSSGGDVRQNPHDRPSSAASETERGLTPTESDGQRQDIAAQGDDLDGSTEVSRGATTSENAPTHDQTPPMGDGRAAGQRDDRDAGRDADASSMVAATSEIETGQAPAAPQDRQRGLDAQSTAGHTAPSPVRSSHGNPDTQRLQAESKTGASADRDGTDDKAPGPAVQTSAITVDEDDDGVLSPATVLLNEWRKAPEMAIQILADFETEELLRLLQAIFAPGDSDPPPLLAAAESKAELLDNPAAFYRAVLLAVIRDAPVDLERLAEASYAPDAFSPEIEIIGAQAIESLLDEPAINVSATHIRDLIASAPDRVAQLLRTGARSHQRIARLVDIADAQMLEAIAMALAPAFAARDRITLELIWQRLPGVHPMAAASAMENVAGFWRTALETAVIAGPTAGFSQYLDTANRLLAETSGTSASRFAALLLDRLEGERPAGAVAAATMVAAGLRRLAGAEVEAPKATQNAERLPTQTSGLVLLTRHLPVLLDRLELTAGNQFRDMTAMARGFDVLHVMAFGNVATSPYPRPLERTLLAVPPSFAERPFEPLKNDEANMVDSLLAAVIQQWAVLGATSVDGLRESFIKRDGLLHIADAEDRLSVDAKAFDMLLDRLPWPLTPIRLPWMEKPLHVEWRT